MRSLAWDFFSGCDVPPACCRMPHPNISAVVVDDELPDYSEAGCVIPMTPSQNDRYERQALVTPEYITIPRGLHSSVSLPEPPYIEAGWTVCFNPEGATYRTNDKKHIVTDVLSEHSDILLRWATHLEAQIKALDLTLPEEYEAYLKVDEEGKTCRYYFVDHLNQTVFWLEDIDPSRHDIGLLPACSVAHTRYLLQEQYWRHCEYFPHRAVPEKSKRDLINIFTQGRADLLTSTMSTFPYSAEECERYLQLLKSLTEDDEYSTWIIARLWSAISRHRYHTFYGEDYARISRDQRRYDRAPAQFNTALSAFAILLFNMPTKRKVDMELLFVDDIAFAKHWQEFAVTNLNEWKESCAMALGMTLIGGVTALRPTNPASACFGSLSVILSLGALASSGLLLQQYTGAEKFTASMAADHLSQIQHPKYDFQPIAMVYAIPRALVVWSVIFQTAHILTVFVDLRSMIIQTPAMALAFLFMFGLFKTNSIIRHGFGEDHSLYSEQGTQ
ncbi:hypothetical protein BC628DRAFT_1321119 [Trametes gibbosa]|nr:hypothetical protein BC628DRAFT_1321119 [Trametes gibbosa]